MRRFWLIGVLLAVTLLFGVLAPSASAQDKRLYWESYDVDITILTNGDFRVVETQHLVFTSGTFTFGIRHIPTEYVANIFDVSVGEPGGPVYQPSSTNEPHTYNTYVAGDEFNIRYNFPPTTDADRTIVLEYTVSGGLLYYPGGDQLVWRAVPADPNFPIQQARVTVHLPPGATATNYDATGPAGTATLIDNGQGVLFETTEPMRGGPDLAVRVQWPHGIVAGAPAPWQEQIDFEERWTPVFNLVVLGTSLFALVAGPLALYLLWYRKGRDAPVKLPAEWIPEPPSDLPPGMVGTLIDERADTKDVMATVVDLARRGVLAIQEEKPAGSKGSGGTPDYIYHLENPALPMRDYERLLVDRLFDGQKERRLSDLKAKFYANMETIQGAIYDAVVAEGYFPARPDRTRNTYAATGVLVMVLMAAVGCIAAVFLTQFTPFALCLPVALGVSGIGMVVLARHMPRKSDKGAEEAAKWLAFKRYMENIKQYTNVEEVQPIFDRYLPYATAFGLDQSWIRTFAQVDTPSPPWYYPGPYLGPRPRPGSSGMPGPVVVGSPGGPSMPAEGGPAPSLGDLSQGMGGSLAGMSAAMGAMLATSAAVLTSRPAPQAGTGSWSSSGGSWSGGGGFSGGGWSGGGGFSGGGGGGSSFG